MKETQFIYSLALIVCSLFFLSTQANALNNVEKKLWGEVKNQPIYLYSVTNKNGMKLEMTNYGAKITSLFVPDRNGKFDDIVLGFDTLAEYVAPNQSFGATIGRYTNRIKNSKFTIDDKTYELTQNEGNNTIHAGGEFERAIWHTKVEKTELGTALIFSYLSPDGAHGFPGNLKSIVTYTLTENNEVHLSFEATTDKKTHVNMTHHGYFNLNGMSELIYDHVVQINAEKHVVLSTTDYTTNGEIESVANKPWDLRLPTRIGDKIHQIPLNGYHHNYVFENYDGGLQKVAKVVDPQSGRTLELSTTQPGVTFYAAMGLTHKPKGKNGIEYPPHIAFCLETQHHVDAANHPQFQTTLLKPNEKYHEIAVYAFGIDK